jgi:Rieske 2Fe-2S family protein
MTTFYKPNDTFIPGSLTLPGRYYTSKQIYALELERIFFERWLCIGRSAQISLPGEYFLAEIGPENGSENSIGSGFETGPESLIVVRDGSGQARAFYNVCRHRGTQMCTEAVGRFPNSIQCPYHAWTYALDGRLIGAPLMEDPSFHKEDHPLYEAALVEWEGFIFLSLSSHPEPFEKTFAPLMGKFSAWNLPGLHAARRIEYHVKANWKLIVQNYSECYHCPLIHPDLARKSPYRSGQNDLFDGPVLGGYMELNHEFGSLTISGRACAAPLGQISGQDLERVYYYAIFPNLLLSLHPDYVMFHTLWPRGPAETLVRCEWLFSSQAMAQPGFDPADAVDFWDMTNRQDWRVCELSQRGVRSRAYRPSPYSGQESLLAAFDRQVLHALGIETP